MDFPTADEVYYSSILENIKEKIFTSGTDFVDITTYNRRIQKYLENKGYILVELRYEYKDSNSEYKDTSCNDFGFWGRFTGDGTCILRIIWGDTDFALRQYGDYRR
jgi:hypothetical protein